jgi:hypothetical protein
MVEDRNGDAAQRRKPSRFQAARNLANATPAKATAV